MRYAPPNFLRRLNKRAFLIGIFLGCGLLAGYGCMSPSEDEPERFEPVPLASWTLNLPGLDDAQTRTFQGRYVHGEPVLLPAGAPFELLAQPAALSATDAVSSSDWREHGGTLGALEQTGIAGRAPGKPGLYRLSWRDAARMPPSGSLTILVLAQAEHREAKKGTEVFAIERSVGNYADPASGGGKIAEHAFGYAPPRWFARLDDATIPLRLSDGLDLGQLVAFKDYRDKNGKKVFTTERHTDVLPGHRDLYRKLALLRERLRAQGVRVSRFWITSGFRTPDYNRGIGGAAFSRHCYGDAADLCIDEDGDRHMDDLNGDGRLDRLDGLVIAQACEALEREGKVVPGGIGVYEYDGEESVRSHVHVDCRGYPARWGVIRRGTKKLNYEWWADRDVDAGGE